MKGYRTYILCGLAIGWAVLTGVFDLGIAEGVRQAVLVALFGAAGITLRLGVKAGRSYTW